MPDHKTRGMIFSPLMVRALLDGRKTQTRRLLKPLSPLGAPLNLKEYGDPAVAYSGREDDPASWGWPYAEDGACDMALADWPEMSGYRKGDQLYVREAHRHWSLGHDAEVTYLADGTRLTTGPNTGRIPDESLAAYFKRCDRSAKDRKGVNYPSIHMPRWASRLTLFLTDVRIQRLQRITEADCIAEGPRLKGYAEFGKGQPSALDGPMVHTDQEHVYATPRCWYRELWGSLHTKPGERWDDDPWVVALSFTVERRNIDAKP